MNPDGSIWYIHPYAGGPGVGRYDRPFHIARHWKDEGFRPVIITTANHHLLDKPFPQGPQNIEGVPYHFVEAPAYKGNGLDRIANMATFSARLLAQGAGFVERYGRPRMIIASSPHPYAFPASLRLARRYGARSVFEVRDLWPLSLVELAGVNPLHPLVQVTGLIERFAYRRADITVSLLPLARDHMVTRGLSPERFCYIPNGVEPQELQPSESESAVVLQARAWRERGLFVIVYAGAIGRPNNVETLARAVLDLRDAGHTRIKAIIVGRGERSDALANLVASRAGQDTVGLFGQVAKREIYRLFDQSDAGYLSLLPEPLFRFGISPNKLFDYMLAALPIISAVRAGNDPVGEAQCGLSVAPDRPDEIAAAILSLSLLPTLNKQAMGQRGRRYVIDNHGYDRLAHRYLSLLQD